MEVEFGGGCDSIDPPPWNASGGSVFGFVRFFAEVDSDDDRSKHWWPVLTENHVTLLQRSTVVVG